MVSFFLKHLQPSLWPSIAGLYCSLLLPVKNPKHTTHVMRAVHTLYLFPFCFFSHHPSPYRRLERTVKNQKFHRRSSHQPPACDNHVPPFSVVFSQNAYRCLLLKCLLASSQAFWCTGHLNFLLLLFS